MKILNKTCINLFKNLKKLENIFKISSFLFTIFHHRRACKTMKHESGAMEKWLKLPQNMNQ